MTKRNHVVPREYLRWFKTPDPLGTRDAMVWMYDKVSREWTEVPVHNAVLGLTSDLSPSSLGADIIADHLRLQWYTFPPPQHKCHSHLMENVTLNQKEQARLQILNSLLSEHMTVDQAATLMGVSTRHTRRILAAYIEEGAAALAHSHRGRRAPNTTPDSIRAEVLSLARTTYSGVNHTHLSELLRERDGIDIARNTLRRILVGAGLGSRRRRPPKHRVRRQRMPREGMLIQIDGSCHRWLGEDGPQFMFLLAVDDATGKVVSALFCEYENTRDYFMLMRGLIERSGIPIALYTDRHSVFKHVPGSGLPSAPTQFSRAMDEFGIQMIYALSPQARGRVERAAGTFQDRLVTELRLAGATNLEDPRSF